MQETEYAWTYTPIDDKNYEKLKGSLTPWGAEVVDVGTPEELKNAMELERKVIVNLTAEIVYSLDSSINVSGNKDLKLNGHKIENEGIKFLFHLSGGCNLKIDGTVQGSGITAKNNNVPVIFNMAGGALTINGGNIHL